MAWTYIVIAGLIEIAWAVGLKYTNGFTRPGPSILVGLGMILTYVMLAQGIKTIPVGTAYAVWTGIGAAGTAIWGMARLGEPFTPTRVICIGLIIAGIVGLKLASSAAAPSN
jgi:quaternary ammonium compound-resistance protein SugE